MAETVKMARAALRGKVVRIVEAVLLFSFGMVKTEGCELLLDWRAEMGMMVSAGVRAWGAVKKLAVRVVL